MDNAATPGPYSLDDDADGYGNVGIRRDSGPLLEPTDGDYDFWQEARMEIVVLAEMFGIALDGLRDACIGRSTERPTTCLERAWMGGTCSACCVRKQIDERIKALSVNLPVEAVSKP